MDVPPDDAQGSLVEIPRPVQDDEVQQDEQPATALALEPIIASVLRAGVIAAMALIVFGGLITFVRHPEYRNSREALEVLLAPETTRSPGVVLGTLASLRGEPLILVGLMFLVATPIARVAVTAALLARRGERTLGRFGLAVLALLLISFALGSSL